MSYRAVILIASGFAAQACGVVLALDEFLIAGFFLFLLGCWVHVVYDRRVSNSERIVGPYDRERL